MVRSYKNGFALLAFLMVLLACSEETIPDVEIGEGRVYKFTISEQKDPSATTDEGIRTLKLVFTDTGGQIVAVEDFEKTDFEGTTTDPVLRGTVTLKVDESATGVYAFANLGSANLMNSADIQEALEVGKPFNGNAIAQIAGIADLTVDATSHAIPMSSHRYDIPKIGGTEDNPKLIESIVLFRMVAKVRVTLENHTEEEVTINSLSLGNFQHRDISLLPYEGLKGEITESVRPVFPEGTSTTYSLPIVPTGTSIAAGQSLSPAYTHYIHETDLGEGTPIQVTAKINDKAEQTAATKFTFVRRNDFLRIPLLIEKNQLVITVVESYAPIGGYPFYNTLDTTEISVHEGSVVQMTVQIKDSEGKLSAPSGDLTLTHLSGPTLLYETTESSYTAQVPAQPTDEVSTYTLETTFPNGEHYTRTLTFRVVALDGTAFTTKSATRSAGASLVLKEFYQLSCQTDE